MGKKGSQGSDTFLADIHMIHVIAPLHPPVGCSLRKCKISLCDEPAARPNKKSRLN